jgi:alanine racemase
MPTPSANKVQINLAALRHNYLQLQEVVGNDVRLLPMVKANAYGHGLIPAARAFYEAGARAFGVAEIDEGVRLREAGVAGEIIVFLGALPAGFEDLLRYDLSPVVFQRETVQELSAFAMRAGKKVGVHVKIDVGMGRLGALPHEFQPLLESVGKLPGVYLAGVMSHLPLADNPEENITLAHGRTFLEAIAAAAESGTGHIAHIANSAALLRFPKLHCDMVRPGIALYGYYPSNRLREEASVSLRPAMSFKSWVIQVKELTTGRGVSYGHTFVTGRPTRLAVVSAGYDDGYSRRLSGRAAVLIRGRRVPVLGTICMNACMADVTELDRVEVGDEVVLLGEQGREKITADEIAGWLGTISYEVLCLFGACNRHEYIDEEIQD